MTEERNSPPSAVIQEEQSLMSAALQEMQGQYLMSRCVTLATKLKEAEARIATLEGGNDADGGQES